MKDEGLNDREKLLLFTLAVDEDNREPAENVEELGRREDVDLRMCVSI